MIKDKLKRAVCGCIVAGLFTLCACGTGDITVEAPSGTKIVLTDGFAKNELFRLKGESCSLAEYMVYLTNAQNQYEQILDAQIWDKNADGSSLEEKLKNTVLARISRIKAMVLLAKEQEVTLTEEEEALALGAAKEYFASLGEEELLALNISLEELYEMYREYALAGKVYEYIIRDINPEISDDEARTITVAHILIKTYSLNGRGERVEFTQRMRERAYDTADSLLAALKGDEEELQALEGQAEETQDLSSFEDLMLVYNEAAENYYTLMHGDMDAAFEEAAFALAKDEISDIIETPDGYEIIKCISTFDQEQTDLNKVKIVEQRRKEVFEAIYEEFTDGLTKNLNEPLWEKITLLRDEEIATRDFFALYETWFEK